LDGATEEFFNGQLRSYSDTWSEGALDGPVGPVSPRNILGKSWPKWADASWRHGSIVEVSL
jgi:hypothetical protein